MSMKADHIVKYVNLHYEEYWSVDRGIDCSAFGSLLRPWLPTLSDTDYFRLRRQGASPTKLLKVLSHQAALENIEAALACPGLFRCRDKAEIDALMAPLLGRPSPQAKVGVVDDSLIVLTAESVVDVLLSAREADMAVAVSEFVRRQSSGYLAYWADPPAGGASLLAYVVAGRALAFTAGITTYLAQPFGDACEMYLHGSDARVNEAPFDRALGKLALALELPEHALPRALLDRLLETNSILFVLNADSLQPQSRGRSVAMHRLVMEAKTLTLRRNARYIPIVLVGTPTDERIRSRTARFNEHPSRFIQFGPDTGLARSEFFERQWLRYCELRGMGREAQTENSRLKRARSYYNAEAGTEAWPATLRMNAFFASNYRTFGYFDPTAGWSRMTGMAVGELPIDIRLHLGEVINRLHSIDEDKKRWPTLRAVQWCSTAVYWLTDAAAIDLGRRLSPRTELKTFHAAVEGEEKLVEIVQEDGERRYKMELAARAAIQDRWMRKSPRSRADAHRQIAWRLYESRDDKGLLAAEFPVEPHWGRSKIHFLVECVRHLVRTCDHTNNPRGQGRCAPEGSEVFPAPPTAANGCCDPYEVINFCFGQLYWRELSGNGRSKHRTSRKLGFQHGAYHLTAELLQLMSDDQQLGKPHWALNQDYLTRYLREVGFAMLDLGDLKGAKQTFENLIETARGSAKDPLDVIDYQLDLTVVLESMEDLDCAERTLDDAVVQFEATASAGGQEDCRMTQQIQTRLRARQAQLSYLRKRYDVALAHCQQIEKISPAALVRDVAHTYISALGALGSLGDRKNLEKAIEVCVRQLFENTSRGLHHEALGFRVALGHAFRKLMLVDAAEAVLDGAYEDILRYGCAERTYLAMLLEAGRVLQCQGRFMRAYAAYLRPCLDRAHLLGYTRTATNARKSARHCLERLVEAAQQEGWSREQIKTELEGHGDYLQIKRWKKMDPGYSYDPIAVERWLPRLQDRGALERELATLAASK